MYSDDSKESRLEAHVPTHTSLHSELNQIIRKFIIIRIIPAVE